MRLFRVAAVALAVLAGTAGCTAAEESAPTPASTPSASRSSSPDAPVPTALPVRPAGSDGLTVRYRDADGQLKTVRVEDFRP